MYTLQQLNDILRPHKIRIDNVQTLKNVIGTEYLAFEVTEKNNFTLYDFVRLEPHMLNATIALLHLIGQSPCLLTLAVLNYTSFTDVRQTCIKAIIEKTELSYDQAIKKYHTLLTNKHIETYKILLSTFKPNEKTLSSIITTVKELRKLIFDNKHMFGIDIDIFSGLKFSHEIAKFYFDIWKKKESFITANETNSEEWNEGEE
jgi:hypothetical protein